MRLLSSCRSLGCALAVALSVGACARQPSAQHPGNPAGSDPPDRSIHYLVDVESKLSINMDYKRVFLQDWKRIEHAVREVLKRSRSV